MTLPSEWIRAYHVPYRHASGTSYLVLRWHRGWVVETGGMLRLAEKGTRTDLYFYEEGDTLIFATAQDALEAVVALAAQKGWTICPAHEEDT